MKRLRLYFLFFVGVLFIYIYFLGVSQSSTIRVDDVSIIKPFGYRYSYKQISPNFEISSNILGLKNNFYLKSKEYIGLKFENRLFNVKTILIFTKVNGILDEQRKSLLLDDYQTCRENKIINNGENYQVDIVLSDYSMLVGIESTDRESIVYFIKQICDGDTINNKGVS